MAQTWKELLGVERVGIHDDFFLLGGHSLLAVKLMERIRQQYQQDLPLAILFQAGTVAHLSKIVQEKVQLAPWSPVVAIQPEGSKPPLVLCASGGWQYPRLRGLVEAPGQRLPLCMACRRMA